MKLSRVHISVASVVVVLVALLLVSPLAARTTNIKLESGPFAPDSKGGVVFKLDEGVLSGQIQAKKLPALGPHAFYVLWFVRTDTGDKAFLGPLVSHDSKSILFLTASNGGMRFNAQMFTDGPRKGSSIVLGDPGSNFLVLIAENKIDTFMPFPISEPPSSFALTATF